VPIKTAIIIDDEQNARKNLRSILGMVCPDVNIIGEADGVGKGVVLFDSVDCDIVFLDIELQDGLGFDFLDKIVLGKTEVIFVTGRNEYAIKAFEYSALDYVLKPIGPDQLVRAVQKSKLELTSYIDERFNLLLENYKNQSYQKIALTTQDAIEIVATDQILYCEAADNYTFVAKKDGDQKLLVSKNIGQMEKLLPAYFFRPHKSYLINLNEIKRVLKTDGGFIVMENEIQIPIARRRKDQFLEKISNL